MGTGSSSGTSSNKTNNKNSNSSIHDRSSYHDNDDDGDDNDDENNNEKPPGVADPSRLSEIKEEGREGGMHTRRVVQAPNLGGSTNFRREEKYGGVQGGSSRAACGGWTTAQGQHDSEVQPSTRRQPVRKVDGTKEACQPAESSKLVGATNKALSAVRVAAMANQEPARTLDSAPAPAFGSKAAGLTGSCANKENRLGVEGSC